VSALSLVARPASYAADAALAEHAERCGDLLVLAMANKDRELALIWQAAMVDIVQLRRSRRFGLDTPSGEVSHGG
jgi:hypothetical protein